MNDLLELYQIANHEGIVVDCFDLKKREALSLVDDNTYYVVIDPFKLTSTLDEKMKLVHELGHCMTGSFNNQYAPIDEFARNEERANRWAIKKLLPFKKLKAAMQDGHTKACDLAEYFSVSEDMIRQAVAYYTDACGLDFSENDQL